MFLVLCGCLYSVSLSRGAVGCMCGPREVCQKNKLHFDNVFLVDEGREDPNTNISGPASARSETPFNGVSLAGR